MHYSIAEITEPVFVEQLMEYIIMYDDFMFYSVWQEGRCLYEHATLPECREFCLRRTGKSGELFFMYDTYLLYIHGHCYSKASNEDRWRRRYHKPWIGFFPNPQKIERGTEEYENLVTDFLEHESTGRVSPFYTAYLTPRDRCRYNSV